MTSSPAMATLRATDRPALRVLGVFALTSIGLTETVPYVHQAAAASRAAVPGLALLSASQLACFPALFARRRNITLATALLALLCVGWWMSWQARGSFPAQTLMVPGYWLAPVIVVAATGGRRRSHVAFALCATAAVMAEQYAFRGLGTPGRTTDQIWILRPAAEALLLADALVVTHHQRTRSEGLARAEEASAQRLRDHVAARADEARLFHDQVLHSLHALARTDDDALIRAECHATVQAVERHRSRGRRLAGPLPLGEAGRDLGRELLTRRTGQEPLRHLVPVAWPGLAAAAATLAINAGRMHVPGWLQLAAFASLAVGLWCTLRLMRHPMSAPLMTLLCAPAVGLWVANVVLLAQDPASDYMLWTSWVGSALVTITVLASTMVAGLVVVAAWVGVQLVALVQLCGWSGVWEHSFVLVTGAGMAVMTWLAMSTSRVAAARVVRLEAGAHQARLAAERLAAEDELDSQWSATTTQRALALVDDVAAGRRAPGDARVRTEAAALETTMRDELVLGPHHPELLGAIAACRANGWRLTSTLSPEDDQRAFAAATELLLLLPPHDVAACPVTVTLSSGARGTSMTVLGAGDDLLDAVAARAREAGMTAIRDDGLLRATRELARED